MRAAEATRPAEPDQKCNIQARFLNPISSGRTLRFYLRFPRQPATLKTLLLSVRSSCVRATVYPSNSRIPNDLTRYALTASVEIVVCDPSSNLSLFTEITQLSRFRQLVIGDPFLVIESYESRQRVVCLPGHKLLSRGTKCLCFFRSLNSSVYVNIRNIRSNSQIILSLSDKCYEYNFLD